MVWMLIFFPSLAIVAGVATIFIAIDTEDGLVVDDYYKQGIEINLSLDKIKRARILGIKGLISVSSQQQQVQVKFDEDIADLISQPVTFKLLHRTIKGLDQIVELQKVGSSNLFSASIQSLPEIGGRWRWDISSEDWRITGNLNTFGNETAIVSFPVDP